MAEEMHQFEVATANQEAFALCLALGTLEAICSGAWPSEAGAWTLARPVFWKPLEQVGLPEEVLSVFRGADELSAMEGLLGRVAVEQQLVKWIGILRARLAALPEKSWYARWADQASANQEPPAAASGRT